MKIGVYFCNCGGNISGKIDSEALKVEALKGGEVEYFDSFDMLCSEDGREYLEKDLRDRKPDRVIILGCSPRDHESTFMRVMKKVGMNPYLMQLINIREHVAWVTEDNDAATEKTRRYLLSSINSVPFLEPLEAKFIDICPDVVILGAGPAGIKAALSLAKADRKVTIVEKSPVIGGLPVRFEDVFPNIECGPCMLEPHMDDILHNENIELITMAEVSDVLGSFGNYTVKIEQKPRYVDVHNCVGCGICVEVCPVSTKNEFNYGLNERKAISIPYEGALPYVPNIDPEICLRFKGEDCRLCEESCIMEGLINYKDSTKIIEKEVGAIVLATGAGLYNCDNISNLKYHQLPDVYTSLEFERMIAGNGPTEGEIKTTDEKNPQAIAIIHCAGSLDNNHKEYCSSICCSYALKQSKIIMEKLPDTLIYHYIREFTFSGIELTKLYNEIKANSNTRFIRYEKLKDIEVAQENGRKSISLNGGETTVADMIILCPPVIPSDDSGKLDELLDIGRNKFGFFESLHSTTETTQSNIRGIYLAGACQSPLDISKACLQGVSAAGNILSELVVGRKLEIEPINAIVDGDRCSGCRTCVPVCPYKAVTFNLDDNKSVVNDLLCHGCGTCVAACPSGAIKANHFTGERIFAEIEGMLK